MKRKKISLYAICMLMIITAVFVSVYRLTSSLTTYVNSMAPLKKNTVIVIDAGHGDFDPGAVSNRVEEKGINLDIALSLRDIFEAHGYIVIMTRTEDTTLADNGPITSSSAKRADTCNRVALVDALEDSVLISIHQNAFHDHAQHGTQVFYGTQNSESELLAESIQKSVISKMQPDNKREAKKGTSSIYILVKTKAPTVLVECGFITNNAEREKLVDSNYQRQIAYSIFLGYTDYEKNKEQ
ncbi:MAG: N-acetylmuramoyl-L-alanine amidase [Oscillospiraceae bacterium]